MYQEKSLQRNMPPFSGQEFIDRANSVNGRVAQMDKRINRFERLAQDTHQIKIDLAVLTTRFDSLDSRADTFATRNDVVELAARLDNCATKSDFNELAARLDNCATKSDFNELATRLDNCATKSDFNELATRLDNCATKSDFTELAARLDNCATIATSAEQSARIDALNVRADTFATKSDLLKLELTTREEVSAVKNEVMSLRVELYKGLRNQIVWSTASMFTVAGLSLAAAKMLFP